MQQVATGGSWALHRRSSSTFTSNGNTVLLIRREGGRETMLREDTARCKPCSFPCLCCPVSVQKDKFSGHSDFPFGDGAISKQTRGPLLGASFTPPGIGSIASMLQIASQWFCSCYARLSHRAKALTGEATREYCSSRMEKRDLSLRFQHASEMQSVPLASPWRQAALSEMAMQK